MHPPPSVQTGGGAHCPSLSYPTFTTNSFLGECRYDYIYENDPSYQNLVALCAASIERMPT